MSRFSTINLSALTPPDIIETLDCEAIVREMRDDLVARFPFIAGVIDLESEPARKLIVAFAYRELRLRARINDGARAVVLASSYGTHLDHLGALFGTSRQDGETDDRHRRRIQLAPEAFSVADRRAPINTMCSPRLGGDRRFFASGPGARNWRGVVADTAHILSTPLPAFDEMDWVEVVLWHGEATRLARGRLRP
jgi:hypothetical protein